MHTFEEPRYSTDYLDPEKRSIANALQITFADGSQSDFTEVAYPLGHRKRRQEAFPLLQEKFLNNTKGHFGEDKAQELMALCLDRQRLENMPVSRFLERWLLP